jgi:hypothetical protein
VKFLVPILLLTTTLASASFLEELRNRDGLLIGYIRPDGDRRYVLDACGISLGFVSRDGTFTGTGVRLSDTGFPYLLLTSSAACDLTKTRLK